ncbi:hypothetical protein [Microbacterium hatanonis]|uniref:Uncharacterized protein n=1 Tax=Microbacterium hatanonis TaxID=404366 RepID=A0A5C8I3A4_9MICO|nr:hypothetical protein [Microbacterium hatanonis]TXK12425.1 hypothetical protein FVP77_02805 [Microbacterium hatanonis]
MSDFARFLPLSGGPRGAETGVSNDRRGALADIVDRASAIIAADAAGRGPLLPAFLDHADLRDEFAALAVASTPAGLTRLGEAIRTGRRRRARALASGARALLLLARSADTDPGLDATTAGVVALRLAGSAPFDRRAVVKGRTVRATDADWSFGRGPVLEGTATGIAAFLLGVSDDPPRPLTGRG